MFGLFSKKPSDSVTVHRKKIGALQNRQREIMAQVAALKEQGRAVQRELDKAHNDFDELRKTVAREAGIKISPVGITSGEQFGTPGT